MSTRSEAPVSVLVLGAPRAGKSEVLRAVASELAQARAAGSSIRTVEWDISATGMRVPQMDGYARGGDGHRERVVALADDVDIAIRACKAGCAGLRRALEALSGGTSVVLACSSSPACVCPRTLSALRGAVQHVVVVQGPSQAGESPQAQARSRAQQQQQQPQAGQSPHPGGQMSAGRARGWWWGAHGPGLGPADSRRVERLAACDEVAALLDASTWAEDSSGYEVAQAIAGAIRGALSPPQMLSMASPATAGLNFSPERL